MNTVIAPAAPFEGCIALKLAPHSVRLLRLSDRSGRGTDFTPVG